MNRHADPRLRRREIMGLGLGVQPVGDVRESIQQRARIGAAYGSRPGSSWHGHLIIRRHKTQ
jgi:hypothetical protein